MDSQDSYQHRGMRRRMVEALRARQLFSEDVLEAMLRVPRHLFLDKAFEEWAYQDQPFPIGHGQTISQPFTVAMMTQKLALRKRDKVLEIGTGSGYQAAVLAILGARVFTVERIEALHTAARERFKALGFPQIRPFYRDGNDGLPEFAPFDRIIATAGAGQIPQILAEQLAIGGVLLVPAGNEEQRLWRVERLGVTSWDTRDLGPARFVPFLGGKRPA